MSRTGSVITILLPLAILLGLGLGSFLPTIVKQAGSLVDSLVLSLLTLLFFEARISLPKPSGHIPFLLIAWTANFVIIPVLAWGIASIFFGGEPALFAGLLLYLLFPCTDWFLAFTRIANGDVALGSALIPINLISQLLLFPVFLALFIGTQTSFDFGGIWGTLGKWFLLPFTGAVLLRFVLSRVLSATLFDPLPRLAGSAIPWVLSALVFCIFSSNASQLTANPSAFPLILLAVFLFFVLTWLLGEFLAWRFRIGLEQHVLLAMTTAARNSPLMLGLATIALPGEPLVYAALIIGMLVEFPHLTVLSRLLLRKKTRNGTSRKPLVATK